MSDRRLPARFWRKVDKSSGGCWHWTGFVDASGYGQYWHEGELRRPHAAAYETLVGPIPLGYVIDHTCHSFDPSCGGGFGCEHRRCVNPAHLEAVTQSENLKRGRVAEARRERMPATCPKGHPLSAENLYLRKSDNSRQCRTCAKAANRAWRASNRDQINERRRVARRKANQHD